MKRAKRKIKGEILDKKKIVKRIAGALVVCAVMAVTVVLCIYMFKLRSEDNMAEFEDKIRAFGAGGILVMFVIQVLQVVLAIIPGEPIELAMGVLYGTVWGCVICLAGAVLGSVLVFLCVRKFGRKFVNNFISSDKFSRLKFLKNPSRRDTLLFILMFIPGTPKDTLTYFAPFTGISLRRFLVISTVARIPSVISSSYIGSSIIDGNYMHSITAFLIVGAVSLAGILVYNKIVASKNKEKSNDEIY